MGRLNGVGWTILVGLVYLGATSCSPQRNAERQVPGVLTVALANDVSSLDRAKVGDVNTWSVLSNVYENLTQIKPGTSEVVPGLAESWEASPDGKTVTFRLRKNVQFHDGHILTAHDVVFSFQRFFDPVTAAPTRQWLAAVSNVEALGENSVRLTLSKVAPDLLTNLAVLPGILSAETFKSKGQDYFLSPQATGPFRFVRWNHSRELVLERFPSYWGGQPRIERLVFSIIPDENARVLALRRGDAQVLFSNNVSPAVVDELAGAGFTLLETATAGMQYIAFNNSVAPFNNAKFRHALAYAVDRDAIVKILLRNHALPAAGPLPVLFPEHSPNATLFPYDLEKAKTLLKESHVVLKTPPNLYYASDHPWNDQLVQAIQSDWAKAGVSINLRKTELGTFVNGVFGAKYDLFSVDIFAGNGSPDLFLSDLFGSGSSMNFFRYKNPEFDAVMRSAQTFDKKKRFTALASAQNLLARDGPAVFLFNTRQGLVTSRTVRGLVPGILQETAFKNAFVE